MCEGFKRREVLEIEWEESFRKALLQGATEACIEILQSLATKHGCTPEQAVKMQAIRIIKQVYRHDAELLYTRTLSLAKTEDAACQEISLILLAEQYAICPEEIQSVVRQIADSPHWEVREWAASACGIILSNHFREFILKLQSWAESTSANIRRCAAVAVKYMAKEKRGDAFQPMLQVIDSLMHDTDPYVTKNLGGFAIGEGLLKYYPKPMIAWLERWAQQEDEQVRCHVAAVFTSSTAAKLYGQIRHIFEMLKADKRFRVQQAVQKAETNLRKRVPGF